MGSRKFWRTLLIVGIFFHFFASFALPLGYDTFLHASYVSDGIDDGDAGLEWGPVRSGDLGSEPTTVDANGKWAVWHTLLGIAFSLFGISNTTLHTFSFLLSIGCLTGIFFITKYTFDQDAALKLTALISLYPPFIRATGRVYQEMWIVFLVCLFFGLLVSALRDVESKMKWSKYTATVLVVPLILMSKGMPWEWSVVVLPAFVMFEYAELRQRIQPYTPILAYLTCLVIMNQNGIRISDVGVFDWLLIFFFCSVYAWLMFVYFGMFLHVVTAPKNGLINNNISEVLDFSWKSLSWILCGWIAALWIVEANNSGNDLIKTIIDFRHNPRYLSLLIVPLWWAMFASRREPSFDSKPTFSFFILACLLSFNAFMIIGAEPQREMEVFGNHIEESISEDTTILFLHDGAFAMHELYVLQFSLDPESDDGHVAYWRTTGSGWQTELSDCAALGPTEWVIVSEHDDLYEILNWTKVEFASDVGWALYERPSTC